MHCCLFYWNNNSYIESSLKTVSWWYNYTNVVCQNFSQISTFFDKMALFHLKHLVLKKVDEWGCVVRWRMFIEKYSYQLSISTASVLDTIDFILMMKKENTIWNYKQKNKLKEIKFNPAGPAVLLWVDQNGATTERSSICKWDC